MQTCQQNKQEGSALLTALFVMTLVAIAATAMTLRLKIDITKAQTSIEASKLKSKANLATFAGMQWLLQSQLPKSKDKRKPDVLAHFKNLVPDTNWEVFGEVIDLQSRFNINNIRNKKNLNVLQRLFVNAGVDQMKSKKIIKLCHYWTQYHRPGRGNDSLLRQFLMQTPPYYPGFQLFTSPSELRLIPGISSNIANTIIPLIISLPKPTPVNILTAPRESIKILGDGITETQVESILKLRNQNQLNNKKKLDELLKKYHIPQSQITIQSNYFLIKSTVKHLDNSLQHFTIVERRKLKNKTKVRLSTLFVSYHTL